MGQGTDPAAPAFSVRIDGDEFGFSAAHFLVFADGTCEPLHGHDFRVRVEASGPLDENQCVVDFTTLAQRLRAVLGELDHAVLLPTLHPLLRVTAGDAEVEVSLAGRRWVFPRADCRLLPLSATTAERLAEHVAGRLCGPEFPWRPARLRVEVEEQAGRAGIAHFGF